MVDRIKSLAGVVMGLEGEELLTDLFDADADALAPHESATKN